MNGFYLALPVFLPILCGCVLLVFRDKFSGKREERLMNLGVEGLVIFNSLMIFLILAKLYGGNEGETMEFTLFRLFGNLTVMFKLDRMGSVFAGLIAFLWPLATLYAFEYMKEEPRRPGFFAYYTMTYGVTAGIAFSGIPPRFQNFSRNLKRLCRPTEIFAHQRQFIRPQRRPVAFRRIAFIRRAVADGCFAGNHRRAV